jgi:ATP-binding cassette subfamily B protein
VAAVAEQSALRRTLRVIRPHLRPQTTLIAGGSLALLLEVAFRVLEPWPVKFVVDAVTRSLGADLADPGPVATTQLLLACGLATISLVGLRAVCNYLATVAFALAGSRIATVVRQRVFDHVAHLSGRFHTTSRSGDVVQRLVADVGRLQEVAITAGLPLIVNIFTLVAMSAVMLWIDPALAVVVVAAALVYVLFARTSTENITTAARDTRRNEGDLANLAQETMGAIRVVQTYGLQGELSRRFTASNNRSLKEGVKARRLAAALERRTDVLIGVATAVVLVFGGSRVAAGAMTPGDLVIFLTYLKTAMKPLRDLAKYTGRIARAAASGERVADLLDTENDIVDPEHPVELGRVDGRIDIVDVTVDHGDGPVLSDVSLHIEPGERVALVGASGSGKSTLTTLLPRLLDPVAGKVLIDGTDVRDVRLADLRAQFSVVLQDTVLLSGTIADNIRHGNLGASDEEVRHAARLAQADGFIERMPNGYDSIVGERGVTLSGGERQRVAVARALLRNAPIVILDEATTGLDEDNADAVREAIATLTAGRTTIIVTHDDDHAREADRVLRVEDGRIVEISPVQPSDSDAAVTSPVAVAATRPLALVTGGPR